MFAGRVFETTGLHCTALHLSDIENHWLANPLNCNMRFCVNVNCFSRLFEA